MVKFNGSDLLLVAIWICSCLFVMQAAPLLTPLAGEENSPNKEESPVEDELLSLQHKLPASLEINQPPAQQDIVDSPPPVVSNINQPPAQPAIVDNQMGSPEKINGYQQVMESPAIDLTPQAVAEYLVLTGDFDGLDMALLDLVRSKILNLYEVEQYKEAVGLEYEKMLQKILDAEASYIQAFNLLYGDIPSMKDTPPQVQQVEPPHPEQPVIVDNQQVQQPQIAETVIEVGKLTAIQDPNGALPMEKYVQSVADKASQNAEMKENNELDKLMEWINTEMEKQLQKAKEAARLEEAAESFAPSKQQQQQSGAGESGDQPQMPVEELPKPEEKPDASGKSDDLENRDNQGKMVIKEEDHSA